jgi:DNA-binding IclR family transcriptional regulator
LEQGFLTKRARVLLCVANDCDVRMQDIASEIGTTERTAYEILCELIDDGYLTRERQGRRNCYQLHPHLAAQVDGERESLSRLLALLSTG